MSNEHVACAECAELEAAAAEYAELCEVPLESVVVSHVRGEPRYRAYALGFRPDLTCEP